MRDRRWLVGIATWVLIVGGNGMAAADGDAADVGLRGPIPFEAFDLDGSGSISREEFGQVHADRAEAREKAGYPAPRRSWPFTSVDADGDGSISREELRAAQGAPGGGRGPGTGRGLGMGMGEGPPAFSEFDRNGDGVITESEFADARAARVGERAGEGRRLRGMTTAPPFAKFDTDGDGALTEEEFGAGVRGHWQGGGRGGSGGAKP